MARLVVYGSFTVWEVVMWPEFKFVVLVTRQSGQLELLFPLNFLMATLCPGKAAMFFTSSAWFRFLD